MLLYNNYLMFFIFKPTEKEIEKFIEIQSNQPFSYKAVGATKMRNAPEDFPINHLRQKLGKGKKVYEKAAEAIHLWQMYALDWTQIRPKNAPVVKGETVITMINHLGFWSLNPCRIIYLIDEKSVSSQKKGFAFGTLPAHSEKGEEQFQIEWNLETDEVFYEIYAFAKPHNSLAKIAFPYVGYLQKSFAADSYQAMLKAVKYD